VSVIGSVRFADVLQTVLCVSYGFTNYEPNVTGILTAPVIISEVDRNGVKPTG